MCVCVISVTRSVHVCLVKAAPAVIKIQRWLIKAIFTLCATFYALLRFNFVIKILKHQLWSSLRETTRDMRNNTHLLSNRDWQCYKTHARARAHTHTWTIMNCNGSQTVDAIHCEDISGYSPAGLSRTKATVWWQLVEGLQAVSATVIALRLKTRKKNPSEWGKLRIISAWVSCTIN